MKYLAGIFLMLPLFIKGQNNLVPNWSFENILDCNPHNGGDIIKAAPWFSAKDFSSTDLYNVCDTNYFHVPNSYTGYQYPRTGNGYAGFIPADGSAGTVYMREYAEVKLIDSLNPGKAYCVSFYINPSNNYSCFTSSIGAVFSQDSLLALMPPDGNNLIDTIPDVLLPTIVTDTLNWANVYGIYNCNTTCKFITIGVFFDENNTTFFPSPNGMYYYLDDVSVVEVSNANAGNDTSMCLGETIQIGGQPTFAADYVWYELADSAGSNSIDSIGIARPHISPVQTTTYVMWKRQCNVITTDTLTITVNCVGLTAQNKQEELSVFPNPANETIYANYTGSATALSICDLLGKEIKRQAIKETKTEIDLRGLKEGIYFVTLIDKQKIVATKKIVVQR